MLKQRIVTAVAMLVFIVLDLFFAPTGLFALSMALLAAAAGWEWGRLAGITTDRGEIIYASVIGLATLTSLHFLPSEAVLRLVFGISLGFWALVAWILFRRPVLDPIKRMDRHLLVAGVLLLTVTTLAIQYLRTYAPLASAFLLLYAFCIIWTMDIGAYFFGRRFGRRKLSPAISPGKSWEGVWGGLAVTLLFMLAVLVWVDIPAGYAWSLVLATLVSAGASVLGDLYESRIKRAAGRKDSSQLLPGHGGVLDRIDGVIAAMPVFAAVWIWA